MALTVREQRYLAARVKEVEFRAGAMWAWGHFPASGDRVEATQVEALDREIDHRYFPRPSRTPGRSDQ